MDTILFSCRQRDVQNRIKKSSANHVFLQEKRKETTYEKNVCDGRLYALIEWADF